MIYSSIQWIQHHLGLTLQVYQDFHFFNSSKLVQLWLDSKVDSTTSWHCKTIDCCQYIIFSYLFLLFKKDNFKLLATLDIKRTFSPNILLRRSLISTRTKGMQEKWNIIKSFLPKSQSHLLLVTRNTRKKKVFREMIFYRNVQKTRTFNCYTLPYDRWGNWTLISHFTNEGIITRPLL